MLADGQKTRGGEEDGFGRQLRKLSVITGFCALLVVCILAESEVIQRFSNAFFNGLIEGGEAIFSVTHPADHRSIVVQISEQDGGDMLAIWPLRFEVYQRFLYRAWCSGAASVFIDISFNDHPGDPSADEDLGRLRKVVDLLRLASNGDTHSIEALDQRCTTPRTGPARVMSLFFAPPSGPRAQEAFAGSLAGTFVESSGTRHVYRRFDDARNLPTAAFALARDACDRGIVVGRPCRRLDRLTPRYRIEINDSILTPADQPLFTRPGYSNEPACVYSGLPAQNGIDMETTIGALDALIDRLSTFLASGPTVSWWACPPVLTVPFSFLSRWNDEELAAVLRGKIVILGSSVPANQDVVATRYFSELPGVFLHAFAVDALLSNWAPPVPPSDRLRVLALFSASLFVVICHRKINAAHLSNSRSAKLRAAAVIMAAVLLTLLYYFIFSWRISLLVSDSLCFLLCNNFDWRWFDLDPVRALANGLHGLRQIVWKEL